MKSIDKLKAKLNATKEQLALAKKTGYDWGYTKAKKKEEEE